MTTTTENAMLMCSLNTAHLTLLTDVLYRKIRDIEALFVFLLFIFVIFYLAGLFCALTHQCGESRAVDEP